MSKRRLNPLIVILLCALAAVLVTVLVLYVFVGYRYINDTENGIKFLGMTKDGIAVDGKLFYSDGTKGKLDSETSTIMLDNGEQYTGDLIGFLPHGKGLLKKADGTVYDGDFLNGICTGNASVLYKSGDVYTGALVDGKRDGFGTYTSTDGSKYVGEFKDNVKNGQGMSTFTDGSIYIGEYKDSIKDGFGAYFFKNGDIYVGEFSSDVRTGRGIYVWAKSEEYSSEFDDLFGSTVYDEGFAKEFFEYFESDFARHFTSEEELEPASSTLYFWQTFEKILTRSQAESYIGGFKDNLLDGEGTYRWLSGRTYKGVFEAGQIKLEENSEENA